MDTATIAQGLRATAALVELAGQTITAVVADSLERLADRVHPPGLDGSAGFDAHMDEADGYFVGTGERA